MRAGPGLPIDESARRIAIYERVESRLFEILGAWAASVPELDVRLRFSADAFKHAWHAELWRERLPELRERNPVPNANDPVERLLAAVAGATDTTTRLVGVHRVLLPRLVAAYSAHLAHSSVVSDGPVIRALELARRDVAEDWQAGELLVQARLTSADAVGAAARHHAALEALVAPSGGLCGPTTLDPQRLIEP